MAGKDVCRDLGRKIDGLSTPAPWSKTLHDILKELYSAQEADLIVRMPFGMATLDRIVELTGIDEIQARTLLEGTADKGVVVDLLHGGISRYAPSPMVMGVFEFTMMRTDADLDRQKISSVFRSYSYGDGSFNHGNFGGKQQMPVMRTMAYEESIRARDPCKAMGKGATTTGDGRAVRM